MQLGGVEAAATCQTRNFNIWCEAVELAAISKGATGEWLREPAQRQRLTRAYYAVEPVWMVADEMIQRWRGVERAHREDADGFAHIRRAAGRHNA